MKLSRVWIAAPILALFAGVASANDELIKLSKDPNQWVMPADDYANTRYSELNQINKPLRMIAAAWGAVAVHLWFRPSRDHAFRSESHVCRSMFGARRRAADRRYSKHPPSRCSAAATVGGFGLGSGDNPERTLASWSAAAQ